MGMNQIKYARLYIIGWNVDGNKLLGPLSNERLGPLHMPL